MGLLVWLRLRRPNTWERPTLLDGLLDSPLHWLVARLYAVLLLLRGRPFRPGHGHSSTIKVVCLSDTHGHVVPDVPDGDLLVHCGDLTDAGSAAAIQAQLDWLAALPHRHKVVVAGNHDSWFDPDARRALADAARKADGEVDFKGVVYLENSSVTLEFKGGRKLNVYGSPAVPTCGGSTNAFQYERHLHPWHGRIPPETDVLVTHTPPRYHLDLAGVGCAGLLDEVWRVKPKLHVFGHVHWGRGRQAVYFDECQRAYETLMARQWKGPLRDLLPGPAWADAFSVLWYGVNSVLFKWLMLGPGTNNGGLMVNAAVVRGNTRKLVRRSPAAVVEL
ncbi:calcineurin-like phosphoesterase [Lasiosphaeria miniovina]|uniref:Calcineurin-like phosphoesterase n=1 Tax=Lasiosphaeria miniovina TaxID=1954250 RepID=A0AA40ALY4_9PEZI|nr:calcineurin-like phosphoesterase [Lasiosphaeria miniovina]KAK0718152.1 calcineurin-like phosphoesterase [Lasiosphaeria miniovina]